MFDGTAYFDLMDNALPYLSVVVTARNDDHGGTLLRRMQTFVNCWIGQCKRHGLSAELIVVDWNPPEDHPPLIQALRWPADTGPCHIRFIQVPPAIHRRYQHAAVLPLYQMIAKNVGIRRARGRFVLVTNIDIIFPDEIVRFLAGGNLAPGRMYRVDRYDVMSDVPVDGPLDRQIAFCDSHLIRINAREGTFNLTPQGLRALSEQDIAGRDSGISLGSGWYAVEGDAHGVFRWMSNETEVVAQSPANASALVFDVEPGPSAGAQPVRLEALSQAGSSLMKAWISHRTRIRVPLCGSEETVRQFRFRILGADLPVPNDPRILNLRTFSCRWVYPISSASAQQQPELRKSEARSVVPVTGLKSRTLGPWLLLMHLVGRLAADEPFVRPALPRIRRLARLYIGVGGFTGALTGGYHRYRALRPTPPGPVRGATTTSGHGALETSNASDTATPGSARTPVFLHTNACGDFTLMAREHWFDLRAYPEFDLFSFNLDSLLCYAAHHAGFIEEVLPYPQRIYHIEHGTGSGWTPEGQKQLFERLSANGIPWLEYSDLVAWAVQMRQLNAPMIFNRENWGLADLDLPETSLSRRSLASSAD